MGLRPLFFLAIGTTSVYNKKMRKDLEKKAEPISAALAALGALGKSVLASRALGTGMQKLLEKIPAARNFRTHAAREGILAGLNGQDLLPKHRRTLAIPFGTSGSGLVDYEMSKELAKHMVHAYEKRHGKSPGWKTIQDMREGIKGLVSRETGGMIGPSSPLYDQLAGTVNNSLSGQGGAAPLSPITRNIVTALQNDELPKSRLMDHLRKYRGTDTQSSKAGLPLAASKGILESLLTGNPAHIPMSMLGSTVDAIPELAVTNLANKGKDLSKILDLKKGIIGEGIMDSLDPVRKKHWGSKAKDLILGGADHTSGEFRALGKDIGNFVEDAQRRGAIDSSGAKDILNSAKKEMIEPARNVSTLGVPVGKALLGDPKQTSRPMALELMIRQALQPMGAPAAIKKNAPIGRVVGNVSSKPPASPTISYRYRDVANPSVPASARMRHFGPDTQPQQAYNMKFLKMSSLLKAASGFNIKIPEHIKKIYIEKLKQAVDPKKSARNLLIENIKHFGKGGLKGGVAGGVVGGVYGALTPDKNDTHEDITDARIDSALKKGLIGMGLGVGAGLGVTGARYGKHKQRIADKVNTVTVNQTMPNLHKDMLFATMMEKAKKKNIADRAKGLELWKMREKAIDEGIEALKPHIKENERNPLQFYKDIQKENHSFNLKYLDETPPIELRARNIIYGDGDKRSLRDEYRYLRNRARHFKNNHKKFLEKDPYHIETDKSNAIFVRKNKDRLKELNDRLARMTEKKKKVTPQELGPEELNF